jgi:hypothetical protein
MTRRKPRPIRFVVAALEPRTEEQRLRREIAESVDRCANADKRENLELASAAIARLTE